MKQIIIEHFFNYEFVYIFLSISIIFLSISIFIKQNIVKRVSIILFSIFFMLFIFDFVLSFYMGKPNLKYYGLYLDYIENIDLIIKDREFEFLDNDNQKYKKIRVRDNFDIQKINNMVSCKIYSTYSNGFRYTKCNKNAEQTYIFLGCSFFWGDCLKDDETSPYNFSKLYNFKKNIINCGVEGQAINTTLNILNNECFKPLMNENSKIEHFFYLMIEDHIYRNFRYEGDCLDGFLYKNDKFYIPTTLGKIKYIFARSYIFKKIVVPFIDKYFEEYYKNYMIESFEEMNKIVQEKYNSKLTILIWPNDYGERFINKLKRTSLDLIFLPEYFNNYGEYKIKHDGHPTAKANEEIAKMLYEHINKENK